MTFVFLVGAGFNVDANHVAKARATRNDKLHAAMMKSALGGNATMQIRLSKQWLGMRDVRALELTGSSGGPLEVDSGLRPILEKKLAEFLRSRRKG